MREGLHLKNVFVSSIFCRPFRRLLANAGGSTWSIGFESRSRFACKGGLGNLSSTVVASAENLRRMQEELHDIVGPGSTPGRGSTAAVV